MENVIANKELKGGAVKQVLMIRDEYVIRTIFSNGARPEYFKKYFSNEKSALKMFNHLINL